MKIAIAGYGNLGKSLEQAVIADDETDLTAIFSRREIKHKLAKSFCEAENFDNADVVLLALGSYDDIANNLRFFRNFHTVDSFDTHSKMQIYKKKLSEIKPNKISVCGVGWDPGTLSLVRGLFAVGDSKIATFWGEGISQGHSNALRSVKGVIDAVEITCPNALAVQAALRGEQTDENDRHKRLCYVACNDVDRAAIEKAIRNMPNYFLGQKTEIVFCSENEVREKKKTTSHSGRVIVCGKGFSAETKLFVQSNTEFTAKIMLQYAKAIPQLEKDGYRGGLDPFDVPLKYPASQKLI